MLKLFQNLFFLLPLTIWAGGLTIFVCVITPTIFGYLHSRTQSGNMVGLIFQRLEIISFFVMGMLVFSELLKYLGSAEISLKEYFVSGLVGAFIAVLLFSFTYISNKIQAIRAQIVSFDSLEKSDPLRKQFGFWHGILMTCMVVSILLGFSVLFLRFIIP